MLECNLGENVGRCGLDASGSGYETVVGPYKHGFHKRQEISSLAE